mmetsp:Transcript_987/g.2662  ORF Transcript_987/g.2662 Transcript_987/m.2662 type:complete len:228 (+) Transcript_987:1688-2371(+)
MDHVQHGRGLCARGLHGTRAAMPPFLQRPRRVGGQPERLYHRLVLGVRHERERCTPREEHGDVLRVDRAEVEWPKGHGRGPVSRPRRHEGARLLCVRDLRVERWHMGEHKVQQCIGGGESAHVHRRAVLRDADAIGRVKIIGVGVGRVHNAPAPVGKRLCRPDEESRVRRDSEPDARVAVNSAVDPADSHSVRPDAQVVCEHLICRRERLTVPAPRRVRLDHPRAPA